MISSQKTSLCRAGGGGTPQAKAKPQAQSNKVFLLLFLQKKQRFDLEPFALDPLALHLAGAANGFGSLAGAALGGLFVMPAELHLAEYALALELLFKRFQRLVDVIIANENLHLADNS